MLLRLSIKNYAIIEELEIAFSRGLNVITGETGAGKSIIAGALGLILGERADSSVLQNRTMKCVVEGAFAVAGPEVREFLDAEGLDLEEELLLRREIAPNGKSRAFINDTPVNLSQLQQLSSFLVDLHRQFDAAQLNETNFQRDVLDALAGNESLMNDYRRAFKEWKKVEREWEELQERQLKANQEKDYLEFQFSELESAAFKENEIENLELQLQELEHAETIRSALSDAVYTLDEADNSLLQVLKSMLQKLEQAGAHSTSAAGIAERLRSALLELKDISDDIARATGQVVHDPKKVEELSLRVSEGYRLLKKHGVQQTSQLLEIMEDLSSKLLGITNLDESVNEKRSLALKLQSALKELAQQLSAARQKVIPAFEKDVNALLGRVGMPAAALRVDYKHSGNLHYGGDDELDFLFDGNRSGQFLPLRRVASGGERNRLMLCIKSLVGRSMDLPTMIFDEIDSGISGEAARQVALIMKELAVSRQLICITHQPQIAGSGKTHFFVFKTQDGKGPVHTHIRELNREERVAAIAQMLGGEKPTAAAIENAREMVTE